MANRLSSLTSILLVTLLVLSGSIGCTSGGFKQTRLKPGFISSAYEKNEQKSSKTVYPWLLWSPSKGFNGKPFMSDAAARGDALLQEGKPRDARLEFERAQSVNLTSDDQESIVFRLASTYLAEGKAELALNELSSYFSRDRVEVHHVSPKTSLFLGYAYGQARNADQSLAWFTRAWRSAPQDEWLRNRAKVGALEVAASLSPTIFEQSFERWKRTAFTREVFAEERQRRAIRGYQWIARNPFTPPLGSAVSSNSSGGSGYSPSSLVQPSGAQGSVGVLLPLTGRYAPLGEATKRGIELAAQRIDAGTRFSFLDSTGEPHVGLQVIQNAQVTEKMIGVLGPLLSESAVEVATFARQQGLPMLCFSKRDDFLPGEGVFRLGVTTAGQASSLIEHANSGLGLTRYASVYPDTLAGVEFNRHFKDQLQKRGLSLIYEGSYQEGDSLAIARLAEMLETQDVQAVFLPGKIADAGLLLSSLSAEARRKIRALGLAHWENLSQLKNSQNVLDGALIVSPFFAQSDRPLVKSFVEAFKASYQKMPDFLAAQGFDAATLFLSAVRHAREAQLPVASALLSIGRLEGVTGKMTIDHRGDIERQYAVVEFKDGALLEHPLSQVLTAPHSFGSDSLSGEPHRASDIFDTTTSGPAGAAPTNQ